MYFYKMFMCDYLQVYFFFNCVYQVSGDQLCVLVNGVLMYVWYIDCLEEMGLLVVQIINKYVVVQVQFEYYLMVGDCLLCVICEVLGVEIVIDVVIDVWVVVYGQLVDIFIGVECQ